jgi:hypothetical protein
MAGQLSANFRRHTAKIARRGAREAPRRRAAEELYFREAPIRTAGAVAAL